MQKEKIFVPKLRFAEFEGIWVMEKLGERCSKIGDGLHGTPQYVDNSGIYFINGNNINSGKIEVYENTKQVSLKDYTKNKKVINLNSLLISLNGTIGNIGWYNNEPVMLGKSVGYLTFSQKPLFEYHYLNTPKAQRFFISQLTGTTIKNLSLKTLRDTSIFFPQPKEQQKIANFLTAVDNQIQSLEKKKSLLEYYKKGVMQKIFKQELRFKDDEGKAFPKWEKRKFADVLFEHKLKSTGKEEVHSVSVHKGVINQIEHLGRSFSAKDTSHYSRALPNDIIYTKSPTGDFPLGIIKQNHIKEDVIISPLYGVFTPETKGLGYILHVYFESPINTSNYLSSIIQKGAKNTINITNTTFLSKKMLLPISKKEQAKIANFLSAIDKSIALVNSKIEHTKTYKKGLLQQMFV